MRVALALCLTCSTVLGQVSYFNQGFLKQGNADLDRRYLGVASSNSMYTASNYLWGLIAGIPAGPFVLRGGDTMTGSLVMQTGGIFSGDGSGVSNVFATNLIWTTDLYDLQQGTITNLDILYVGAAYASVGFSGDGHALTNLALSSLPSNVITNRYSGNVPLYVSNSIVIAQTNDNSGLYVTNGAKYVVATNGVLKTTGAITCLSLAAASSVQGAGLWSTTYGEIDGTLFVGGGATKNSITYADDAYGQRIKFSTGSASINQTNGNILTGGIVAATNGIYHMVKVSFVTNFTCTTNFQWYLLNGTNQIITLPNAANVPNKWYHFTTTNNWCSYIITNATGTQTIRNGTDLSYTNSTSGLGVSSFLSDGAHWWLGSKGKLTLPRASYSTTTNVPMPLANQMYPIGYDFTEITPDPGSGLALVGNPTNNNFASRIYITNAGTYMLSYSAVINAGAANDIVRIWLSKDGVNVPRSNTKFVARSNNAILTQTVNYFLKVDVKCFFELFCQASNTGSVLESEAASGNYPICPSVILTVNKVSD